MKMFYPLDRFSDLLMTKSIVSYTWYFSAYVSCLNNKVLEDDSAPTNGVFVKAKCGSNHRGLDFESQNMAMHEDS